MDRVITAADGRPLGVAEFGDPDGTPVLWCHGGPGSRLEPLWLHGAADRAGLRIVGFDRPGYGLSEPRPGRTIVDTVTDMLAVADRLALQTFATVGVSTGGAYALALAAVVPDRVRGVVACCSMTDMSWAPGRATAPCFDSIQAVHPFRMTRRRDVTGRGGIAIDKGHGRAFLLRHSEGIRRRGARGWTWAASVAS